MTPDSLALIRHILTQVNLPISDPDFRTTALRMIALLDDLDKEEANANNFE